jgi:hypothetical protein
MPVHTPNFTFKMLQLVISKISTHDLQLNNWICIHTHMFEFRFLWLKTSVIWTVVSYYSSVVAAHTPDPSPFLLCPTSCKKLC